VEILQTSLEQFKIEQYKRTNNEKNTCWWDKLYGFLQTRNNKKVKGIPAVLDKTGLGDTTQDNTQESGTSKGTIQDGNTVTMSKQELQTLIFVALLTGGIIGSLLLMTVR
jgi:hypothetical protein